MRLVVFDDYRIGTLYNGLLYDVSEAVPDWHPNDRQAMNRLIADWETVRSEVEHKMESSQGRDASTVVLRPPVPQPIHLFAAPINYAAHKGEVRRQTSTDLPA